MAKACFWRPLWPGGGVGGYRSYLKAIYDLGGGGVKTQNLADTLSVSAASVSGMIKKLSDLNLIRYEKYRGVSLTPAGQKIALETLRHHRLIETYLAEALGYPWHDVHDEAERLEHFISEDFEARSPRPSATPASTRTATPSHSSMARCPKRAPSRSPT